MMDTITITLSDERLAMLRELAARFKVNPEELARRSGRVAFATGGFESSVEYVLRKNGELYRRLT
jgi:CRISPR/Cas system-associated protein Csx1